jgi:hypothetical protein
MYRLRETSSNSEYFARLLPPTQPREEITPSEMGLLLPPESDRRGQTRYQLAIVNSKIDTDSSDRHDL